MGKMADRTYLQRRVLNRSKGPAVWALRAQTDKREYAALMKRVLEETPNLSIREGMATEVVVGKNEDVVGVKTFFGVTFRCKSLVLTTGTFMARELQSRLRPLRRREAAHLHILCLHCSCESR
jgi:tRNA uridine 5-carboxymethylaminomethyl modification enzyme